MGIKEDFNSLQPAKAAMIGIVIAVVYYFVMFDKGDAISAQKATLQVSINERTERLKQVENAMNNKAAFEREVDELTKNFDDLIKYFPVDLDMNNLLYQVRKRLEATNNKLDSMKKGEPKARRYPGYAESTMEVKSVGGFHEAMKFLASLTAMDRVVDFIELDMKSNGSTDELSQVELNLMLSVFSQEDKSRASTAPNGGKGG